MLSLLTSRGFRYVLAALGLLFFAYLGVSYIKSMGYNEAKQEYTEIIAKYNESLATKMDAVILNSTTDAKTLVATQKMLTTDIKQILSNTAPIYVIDNGKCGTSSEFNDKVRQAIDRTNKELKEYPK